MQQFYFEDRERGHMIVGIRAHDDKNVKPYDYYVYWQALSMANRYTQIFKNSGHAEWRDNEMVDKIAMFKTEEFFEEMLRASLPDARLIQILSHNEWSKKQQVRLWRNMELSTADLLWFNWLAQQIGYLLDVTIVETNPKVFDDKQFPIVYQELADGRIDKIGETNMSDGEMRALLRQRRVQNVRIYHKGDVWHCFYGTYKGINGEEPGPNGSRPHCHYVSNKWGIKREDLLQRIRDNNMPSSVHVFLKRTRSKPLIKL